ncbi:hypothetical protein [Aureimonas sp. AU22]|uniref:hypothetical protein n=1 Tax=Aureimonas sp. AU22 TaxID=1638162 RepID=UPI0007824E32|nr:hypothetical protein [Aureimonas sp. AU22]
MASKSNSQRTNSYIGAGIITPAAGGGVVPSVPAIYGLVTKTTDGSVGQTYTGPNWTSPQWYRETLASPKQRTAISGAISRTYTATNDDIGFRLVMAGTDAGTQKVAAAWNPVPVTAIVLQDFATTTAWSPAGSPLPTLAVDWGKLVVTETGAAGRAYKSIGTQTPSEWDVVTFFQDRGTDPAKNQSNGPTYGFATDTAYRNAIGGGPRSGLADDGTLGVVSTSRNVSEVSTLAAINTPTVLNMSTAASFTGSNNLTVRKHIMALAKSRGMTKVAITMDDGYDTQYTKNAGQAEAYGFKLSFFAPWEKFIGGAVSTSGRMTLAMVKDLYARGHAICLDGTADDGVMTASSNGITRAQPSDNVAEIERGRAWLAANGLVNGPGGYGGDGICYPDGVYEDRTTVGGPYDRGKLPAALKGAGVKLARTTDAGTYPTRYGFNDGCLLFPSCSTSNLDADALMVNVNRAIQRGATVMYHFHQPLDVDFTTWLQRLAQLRDAGTIEVVTIPQLIAADYGASFPS